MFSYLSILLVIVLRLLGLSRISISILIVFSLHFANQFNEVEYVELGAAQIDCAFGGHESLHFGENRVGDDESTQNRLVTVADLGLSASKTSNVDSATEVLHLFFKTEFDLVAAFLIIFIVIFHFVENVTALLHNLIDVLAADLDFHDHSFVHECFGRE